MNLRTIGAFLLLGILCAPLPAQFWDTLFNPEVEVTFTHPPSLGIKARRVAFAPAATPVAEDLVAACISDLAASGEMEVLDRGNIEKVLNEQKFANTGLVDEKSAVELGRLLGSPVLIFVKVPQSNIKHIPLAATKPGWTETGGAFHPPVTTYTSKTQIDFTASIQAVDLATGRIHSQQRIAVSPSRQVSSEQGAPEFPSDTEVRELAVGLARDQVRRMLLPWTEKRKLIFYDDKNYGMKEAYMRIRLDDGQGALQKSLEALEAARADRGVRSKYLGHANYNVGMCHLILGNYNEALPFLKAARETDPKHRIYAGAEAECLGAIKLQAEMSRVEAASAKLMLDLPPADPAGVVPARAEPAKAAESRTKAPAPVEERLEQLERLKKKGLLSPEEYSRKKAEIMQDL